MPRLNIKELKLEMASTKEGKDYIFPELAHYMPDAPRLGLEKTPYKAKLRTVFKLNKWDKRLQRFILKYIQKRVTPLFQTHVLSVKGKGVDSITEIIADALKAGYKYVLILDIQNCFNELDHLLLEKRLEESGLFTSRFIELLRNQTWEYFTDKGKGIPQGYPLSPMLLDLFLMPFDDYLTEEGYRCFRYMDDVGLFFTSIKRAEEAKQKIEKYLKGLKLQLNSDKCRIERVKDTHLLGYQLFLSKRKKVFVRADDRTFKKHTQYLIEQHFYSDKDKSLGSLLVELQDYMHDWLNGRMAITSKTFLRSLNQWVYEEILLHTHIGYYSRKKRYSTFSSLFGKTSRANRLSQEHYKPPYRILEQYQHINFDRLPTLIKEKQKL